MISNEDNMNTLKITKILILGILGVFVSCTYSETNHEEIKQTIMSLEHQALNEWSKGNPAGFPKNFADDATYFDDIGAHNRLAGMEEITAYFQSLEGKITPHKYETVNPKVQFYGDIVILTFRYNSRNDNNEPGPPWKATSIYRLNDNNWQVVHANWSLIKE